MVPIHTHQHLPLWDVSPLVLRIRRCQSYGRIGYRLTCPKVVEVKLTGTLAHGVSSKDIILKLLELLSVKGGVGKVFEYTGEGS